MFSFFEFELYKDGVEDETFDVSLNIFFLFAVFWSFDVKKKMKKKKKQNGRHFDFENLISLWLFYSGLNI